MLDAERNGLVWVDIVAGRVHLLDPSTGVDHAIEVGQPVGAAVPAGGSSLALAIRDGFAILDLDTASVELIAEVEKDLPSNRMNDGNITGARQGMADDERAEQPLAGGLLHWTPGVQGQPTRSYAGAG